MVSCMFFLNPFGSERVENVGLTILKVQKNIYLCFIFFFLKEVQFLFCSSSVNQDIGVVL